MTAFGVKTTKLKCVKLLKNILSKGPEFRESASRCRRIGHLSISAAKGLGQLGILFESFRVWESESGRRRHRRRRRRRRHQKHPWPLLHLYPFL